MATFDKSLNNGGRGFTLRLTVNVSSQDIEDNTTTLSWSLVLHKGANSWDTYTKAWSVNIGGKSSSGSLVGGYDFRGYSSLTLGSGSKVITHNADGKKTITVSGTFDDSNGGILIGSGTASGSMTLPEIPRATQPTVSPTSGNTGVTYIIGHEPASSAFYHDVAYSLDGGDTYTDIQTNIVGTDESTNWTPAHSLLPNSTFATATIRVRTRASSGGTIIGTKTVDLPLTVPSNIRPTISSVTWEDAQTSSPNIPAMMGGDGRFVQGWSKLKPTVAASPASGSTVVSASVTQNGQVTQSGSSFGNPVGLSGAVPFNAVATDSRGRNSVTFVDTVAVAAYSPPNLPTPSITRTSDAAGNFPAPTGTYLAITPSASVSSLLFGGDQKNLLEWQVRTRPAGGSWSTVQAWTSISVSGTVWTSKRIFAGYAANTEYEVEVSIRDVFGKNGYNTASTVKTLTVPVPSEFVFMDWDGNDGIGVGGYRRYGLLDVHGDAYVEGLYADEVHSDTISQNGNAVLDTSTGAPISHTHSAAQIDSGELSSSRLPIATEAEAKALSSNTVVITPRRLADTLGMVKIRPSSVGTGASIQPDDSVVFTGDSALDINGIFSSDFARYKITLSVDSLSSATGLFMRFRTSSTITATNYNYARNYNIIGTPNSVSSTNQSRFEIVGGSGTQHHSEFVVYNPAVSGTPVILGQTQTLLSTETVNICSFGGSYTAGGTFTGINIFPGTGTITGRISIFAFN